MRRDFSVTCFEIIFRTVLNSIVHWIRFQNLNIGWIHLSELLIQKYNLCLKKNCNTKNEIFSASNNVFPIVDLDLINSNWQIGN